MQPATEPEVKINFYLEQRNPIRTSVFKRKALSIFLTNPQLELRALEYDPQLEHSLRFQVMTQPNGPTVRIAVPEAPEGGVSHGSYNLLEDFNYHPTKVMGVQGNQLEHDLLTWRGYDGHMKSNPNRTPEMDSFKWKNKRYREPETKTELDHRATRMKIRCVRCDSLDTVMKPLPEIFTSWIYCRECFLHIYPEKQCMWCPTKFRTRDGAVVSCKYCRLFHGKKKQFDHDIRESTQK